MKDHEIFQVEELEARLEMQPLPLMIKSSCSSNCDSTEPPMDPTVNF
jgi:hypothetical protein